MNSFIKIEQKKEGEDGWKFSVSAGGEEFAVTVQKEYWQKLTNEKKTPEKLVEHSFAFLLEHESVSAILKEFDLSDIQKYFPEYEKTMMNHS